MNLHPLRLDAIAVEALLQIVRIVLGNACFVSWTAEAAAIFQCWRLIQREKPASE